MTKATAIKKLTGDEAIRRIKSNPESVFWSIPDFCINFGLEWGELLAELRSGRLQAAAFDKNDGPEKAVITVGAYALWMMNIETPPALRLKVTEFMQQKSNRLN